VGARTPKGEQILKRNTCWRDFGGLRAKSFSFELHRSGSERSFHAKMGLTWVERCD
jgi:hypothetical protein